MSTHPLQFASTLAPEDAARASLYGLIARLFYAAPDERLLADLLHMEPMEGTLAPAWQAMIDECRNAYPVVLENEHTELFVGTGKAEVTPYLTHYTLRHENDSPLVELRQQLAAWGLGRQESASEPEDHVSGVCETLRLAIAVQQRSLEEQCEFFDRFLHRGGIAFCDAVSASAKARFYARVARFTRSFLELEDEAFRMM